jgi:hypothetical protein
MVVAVLALAAASCTGSDDGPTVGSSPSPTITLADCPVTPAQVPSEWPLLLPRSLVVSEYAVNGNAFLARGITNDPERLLVEVTEETLADFVTGEPDGGANDVVVVFESSNATGSLFMSDPDENDCWDVDLEIDFLTTPEPSEFVQSGGGAAADNGDVAGVDPDGATGGDGEGNVEGNGGANPGDAGGVDDGGSGLAEASGDASITTARGTFPLLVESCQFQPLAITATAAEGDLIISQVGAETSLTWTYADGVVISDTAAKPIVSTGTALIVGDGQNNEGPETVIVDISCDV